MSDPSPGCFVHKKRALLSGEYQAAWTPQLLWALWRGDKSACTGNRTPILRFSHSPDITKCVLRLWGERVRSEVNPDKAHNSRCSVAGSVPPHSFVCIVSFVVYEAVEPCGQFMYLGCGVTNCAVYVICSKYLRLFRCKILTDWHL